MGLAPMLNLLSTYRDMMLDLPTPLSPQIEDTRTHQYHFDVSFFVVVDIGSVHTGRLAERFLLN